MIEGSCHCGAVHWRLDGRPDTATACNCTVCRRYGALWAYGHEHEDVRTSGETRTYAHGERSLGFHFCPDCGCVAFWRGFEAGKDGRRRMGVNLRLAEPGLVASIPVKHFDGLNWRDPPLLDGRRVADMWF
jgi:hypothetical protein